MRMVLATAWRIVGHARSDNLTGEAAKVAYYSFLSIWPLFLGLFAFTGLFGGDDAFEWIMGLLQGLLPGTATGFLADYVAEITSESRPDMLSLGLVLTLWSGSNIFSALCDGLNAMYGVEEGRSWWRKKAISLGTLLAASVLVTAGAAAILAGAEILAGAGFSPVIRALRWPAAYALLAVFLWIVYIWLPAREQKSAHRYVAVGALVGAALLVATTGLFRLYVANFGKYETYGVVGAVMVLLLWLYLTALSILFGGEVAASLEQESPGRASG